jgi:hypothetical protein
VALDTEEVIARTERRLPRQDRSFGELFSELTHETTTLVRKEVELAKAEMSQKIDRVQNGLISLAAGGAVLYAGFLVLLLAIVAALDALLDQWWPSQWLAPLIVAVVVLAVGYVLLQKGLSNMKADNFVPRRTFRSLRRDGDLARSQVR